MDDKKLVKLGESQPRAIKFTGRNLNDKTRRVKLNIGLVPFQINKHRQVGLKYLF